MGRAMQTFVAGVAMAGLLAGCATTSGPQPQQTEVERAIGKCVASVAVGALLGAVVGNNTGNGDAKRGAVTGAAAGGVACAVLLAVASEKDRILAAQRNAVAMGGVQNASYRGEDGSARNVRTRTEEAQVADGRLCRYATTEVEIPGKGSAPVGRQLYCRDAAGDWGPASA